MKVPNSETLRRNEPTGSQNDSGTVARPWVSPLVQTLPRLTELTLQSGGIPGGGGTGGGGSTVVP
jgi:hypothetical protein